MLEKIYIIHYKENLDRKEYLLKASIINSEKCVWNTSYQTINSIPADKKYTITDKLMCVSLAHEEVMKEIVNSNINNYIIFEDDVLINEFDFNLEEFINNCLKEFNQCQADILYFTECPGWDMSVKSPVSSKLVYEDVKQCSVGTHAYMIKKPTLIKMLEHIEYDLPIDHEHNRLINVLNLKVAWTYPAFTQGTWKRVYKSNLRE
jgi:GR25 family glycosyltransferase involved in LPS biosynthesis